MHVRRDANRRSRRHAKHAWAIFGAF